MRSTFRIFLIIIFLLSNLNSIFAQWVQQSSGVTSRLTDVVMLDSTTAIAVGRNGSILRTTNSGQTWFDIAAPLSYIVPWNSISFYDTLNGSIAGDHGVVFTTSNGGKNWLWHQIPANQKCISILQTGTGSIYVGTDSGWVFSTIDTAKTWNSEKISDWSIRTLFTYRGPSIMRVSMYALTPFSICTQYAMPPPNWSEIIIQQFQALGSQGYDTEYCNGGGTGFIVGVHGDLRAAPAILRKSMPDTSWLSCATGIHEDGTFFGISAPSEKTIYVCGSNGMIYKSSDGGDNWIKQNSLTNLTLNAVYFFDENKGIAVGDSGLIMYTSNGGLTGVNGGDYFPPHNFLLEQNFPNPFNPTTVINYQLSKATHVSLIIFDALGREVLTIVDEYQNAGTYHKEFNSKNYSLACGAYFYQFRAGDFVSTKKMLLLK